MAKAAQRGGGVCIIGGIPKPSGRGSGQPAQDVGTLLEQRVGQTDPPLVPPRLSGSVTHHHLHSTRPAVKRFSFQTAVSHLRQ